MSMMILHDQIRLCQSVIKRILWDGSNSCRICGFVEGHTKDCPAEAALTPAPQEDATIRERFLRVALVDVYAQACLNLHQYGRASLQEALILCVEELAKFHQHMMKEVAQYNLSRFHVEPITFPATDHMRDALDAIDLGKGK